MEARGIQCKSLEVDMKGSKKTYMEAHVEIDESVYCTGVEEYCRRNPVEFDVEARETQ